MKIKNQIRSIISGALIAAFAVASLTANVQAKTSAPLHNVVALSDTGKMKKDKMSKDKMSHDKMGKKKMTKKDKMGKDTAGKM